ncbi:COP9 signalosome complex subunit 6 [Exaiptasia diaphana]|uniref:COP9 signalosome complex subunit 6 n=1 Tax=Exaiptasia diaphana TaxID=2652724 RepID=A0A913XG20_EXADI|nr:COP9 signalosome complex subunit 6 [Exaiptasia diaphana]KXJ26179.1 COP9 signalosome complex subunit 6 [Exaiptasia diaphana]
MATPMEVQGKGEEKHLVVASSGAAGSVSVALHPLVIMNISEHYTRIRAQEGKPNPQVVGALLGTQDGRNVEIFNSFELQFDVFDDGHIIINMEYYRTKEEQFRQVFKNLDFLGWYSTGIAAQESDIGIHKQVCEINESPLFLKLNPLASTSDLPITMYESVIDLIEGETRMLFVEVPYTLATEEAERIGVDHVARLSATGTVDGATVSEHLLAQYNAIKMLLSRVKMILEYVNAVKKGEVPCNHEIMRDALSLCQRLPVMKTEMFKEGFYDQCNDVMLMCYLATVTKGCNSLNEFINKFTVVHDRHGIGRRMRGLLF